MQKIFPPPLSNQEFPKDSKSHIPISFENPYQTGSNKHNYNIYELAIGVHKDENNGDVIDFYFISFAGGVKILLHYPERTDNIRLQYNEWPRYDKGK